MSGGFYETRQKEIRLRVRAKPGSRQDAVLGVRQGELVVAVRAVAEKGRANTEIARVLSDALGVARRDVELKSGPTTPHKVFLVPLSAAAALERWRTSE